MGTTRKGLIAAVVCLAALVGVVAVFSPDGQERWPWLEFWGRFHPLVVHLPIGILLLVPVLEVCGCWRRWRFLRPAAGFVLGLGVPAALAAALCGWMLAYAGGYRGERLDQHMWGGVGLAAAVVVAWWLRPRGEEKWPWTAGGYVGAQVLVVGILLWTGHQGGALTHGETYLVQRMPGVMKTWLGVSERRSVSAGEHPADAFYVTHVDPIFEAHCVLCHGPDKVKGGLRLDTFARLMEGGDYGPSIEAGDAEASELYRRITLPHDDEEFMPSEGKRPLTSAQVEVIRQWILDGASPTRTLADLTTGGGVVPEEEKPVVAAARAPDYRGKAGEIARLQKELNVRLVPVSQRVTDGLILRTVSQPQGVTDETLAALAPVAELIVDAELARTAVSDAGLAALGKFENLRRLDLSQTGVSTAGLSVLPGLKKLEWVSLVGTEVDDAGAELVKALPSLRQAYFYGSKVTADAVPDPEPDPGQVTADERR